MALRWTNAETLKFIKIYQNEPCVWNPKHKHHKDKLEVNDAWLRIADAMGVSVTEVKKKKETLLAAFRLNHRKVIESRKSGAGKDEIFKPIWVYYDALAAFMSDIYVCKSLLTSPEYVQDEDSLVKEELSPSWSSQIVMQDSDELSSGEERENAAQTTPRISVPVQKRRRHKFKQHETNTQVENASSALNNVSSENKKQLSEDDCDLYGRLLAKKLRKYTELERLELMYEIDGLLLKKLRSRDSRSSSRSSSV